MKGGYFVSQSEGGWYHVGIVACDNCTKEIEIGRNFHVKIWWSKTQSVKKVHCVACKPLNLSYLGVIKEVKSVIRLKDASGLPSDALYANAFETPQVGSGHIRDGFDHARDMKEGVEVIDKTKYFGKPNYTFIGLDESKEIYKIGELRSPELLAQIKSRLDELEHPVDPDSFFEQLKTSKSNWEIEADERQKALEFKAQEKKRIDALLLQFNQERRSSNE